MEGAYTVLYQEFLRLRSLCLKQAALLQQLTEALKRQESQLAPCHNQLHGLGSSEVVGTISNVLARDMERLQLYGTYPGIEKNAFKAPVFVDLDPPGCNTASRTSHSSRDKRQIDQLLSDDPTRMYRIPRLCGSYLDSDFLTVNGGMLMSELALQSQVCDFCQAVFPGHTTTKGDFLRHLDTHIP
ncbi:uncharacterized protein zgc:113184 isoform X2 [Hypomesus transpacificus]|uniref:uncharacterized protein zgc:113184 isoform X2 n=1 Tax=Hypomesus transpacificus TaxID=137520 RepID=UPI001F08031B|nr:uncharacterized protein zgc:113184 isoform X2 [Hypomesus transpacificus]